jgi:hypothetical protein
VFLAAITTLAVGGACFVIAWIRTIWFHYVRSTEPADLQVPDLSVSKVDRVTAWLVPIIISAAFLAAPEPLLRLIAIVPVVTLAVFMKWWRAYPTYAFPVIDAVGVTRAVALTVGSIAGLRALINFRTADRISLILLVVAGGLLLAAAVERWPGVGRRRRTGLGDRMANLEHRVVSLEKDASTQQASADHRRPRWLIILIAVACAAGAGYALWRALYQDGRSDSDVIAFLVFAGFALILAVGGERLTSLTFKSGAVEVDVGLGSDNAPAAGDAPQPKPAVLALNGQPARAIQRIRVRGNADEVAAVLKQMLPSA